MTARGKWNIVFIGIGAIIVVAILLWVKQCNQPKPDIVATGNDSTQYFKNKVGQEVAATKKLVEDYYQIKEKGYLNEIAKLHNSKATLIQEVISLTQKGNVVITTALPPTIVYKKDTTAGACPEFESVGQIFANNYYVAHVSIGVDTSAMNLETYDTLRIVAKVVKEGRIFNRKSYLQIDAVNTNPYNKIEGLQVYRKPLPKQKKIGIGPFVGYGFGGTTFKPSVVVGVGVTYAIIKL